MTAGAFVRRGLRHYRSSYLGVVVGAALGAMVLLGALFAGDSVRGTLRKVTEARIGKVDFLLVGGDRFFRDQLAEDLRGGEVTAAPVLFLEGSASARESGLATGRVQIVGVDPAFWKFRPGAGEDAGAAPLSGREVFVNEHLARTLEVADGETVVLRFAKPGLISRDAPLAGEAESVITIRGTVREVLGEERFGRFSLEASQLPRATVFLPLARLQESVGQEGMANLLLLGDAAGAGREALEAAVETRFTLADYGLSLVDIPLAAATEIRTSRVFFDRRVESAIRKQFPDAQPVITYLANTIAANGRETPYSMVTAAGRAAAPFLPEAGVAVNAWIAEDLGVVMGDTVTVSYYAVAGGSRLEERSVEFRVGAITPMEGLPADRKWMPDFPGVSEAETTGDWSPGLPLDLARMRDKDDEYWERHRGTPKVIVPLEEGQELFANRWGEFTALRVPEASRGEIGPRLLAGLRPATAGVVLQDFRGESLEAAKSPVDIAGLFLSMSFFLIVAAVALTAMLFRFNVEQRNRESGLLAAVGVPSGRVLRWRLGEGLWVVGIGVGLGFLGAAAYTRGILRFLETIWSEGNSGRLFRFEIDPVTAVGGAAGFVILMMGAIWLTVRKQVRRSASVRLEAGTEEVGPPRRRARGLGAAIGAAVGGCVAMGLGGIIGPQGAFFAAGFAWLVAGLCFYRWRLGAGTAGRAVTDVRTLAAVNSGRRPLRSLVVVGALASGVFLVVSVAAFRKHTGEEWQEPSSGAGGFAFWVETTSSLTRAGDGSDDFFELGDDRQNVGEVVPVRIGRGDDASCFNLNAVRRPRLLATDVSQFEARAAFEIKDTHGGLEKSWITLGVDSGEALRAFVDETTLMWVLKMKVGDRIAYEDEWGRGFEVEIAGTLADSVFQGSLVVDEARFLERYPSADGYRLFLTGAAAGVDETRGLLQRSLADRGAEVTTTRERLAAFHGVENTYIAIFHVLGGLGVVLGAAGLGLVTMRNLSERRYEFGVLHTIGVPREVARRLVFREAGSFIGWGLGIGLVAAVVAVVPNLGGVEVGEAAGWIVLLAAGIALNAWFWSWLGYRKSFDAALRAPILG